MTSANRQFSALPISIASALTLTACAPSLHKARLGEQHAATSRAAFILPPSAGGNVEEFAARARELQAQGRPVVIRNQCDSACAILASLPIACIERNARVGLHQPSQYVQAGKHRLHLGPSDTPAFYQNVTPQISAKLQALEYDWANPERIQTYITWATAPEYGLRQCQ